MEGTQDKLDVSIEDARLKRMSIRDYSCDFLRLFIGLCADNTGYSRLSSVSSVVANTYLGIEPWQFKGVGVRIMEEHMKIIDEFDEKDANGRLIHTIVVEHIVGLPLEELHINVKQEYRYEADKP